MAEQTALLAKAVMMYANKAGQVLNAGLQEFNVVVGRLSDTSSSLLEAQGYRVSSAAIFYIYVAVMVFPAMLMIVSYILCRAPPGGEDVDGGKARKAEAGPKRSGGDRDKQLCCTACGVALPETAKEIIERHMGGKRHQNAIKQLQAQSKPTDRGSLLQWLPEAAIKELAAKIQASHKAKKEEQAEGASDSDAEQLTGPPTTAAAETPKPKPKPWGTDVNEVLRRPKGVAVVYQQTHVEHPEDFGGNWQKVAKSDKKSRR